MINDENYEQEMMKELIYYSYVYLYFPFLHSQKQLTNGVEFSA